MNFFDWYSASYGLLTIALFEVLVLMQVYGKCFNLFFSKNIRQLVETCLTERNCYRKRELQDSLPSITRQDPPAPSPPLVLIPDLLMIMLDQT